MIVKNKGYSPQGKPRTLKELEDSHQTAPRGRSIQPFVSTSLARHENSEVFATPLACRNKKILVTGANGFIGSHLTQKLVALGAEVTAMTKGGAQSLQVVKDKIKIIQHDLNSTHKSADLKFDAIFHLAALTDLRTCSENPLLAYNTNVLGTLKLIEQYKSVGTFILISTLGVYGEPLYLPIDENHPALPIEPYAASKAAAESVVIGVCSSRKIRYAIARLFNVYGPGQRDDFVIPRIINQALTTNDVVLKNRKSTRDFIYIDDVIDALIKIYTTDADGIYNVGSGKETSIGELASIIQKHISKKIDVTFVEEVGSARVQRSLADIKKIKRNVGWNPSTDLSSGITKMLNYYNDIQ